MEIEKIPFRFIKPLWEERRGMVLPCLEPASGFPSCLIFNPHAADHAYRLGFVDAEKNVLAELLLAPKKHNTTFAKAQRMLREKKSLPRFLSLAPSYVSEDALAMGLAAFEMAKLMAEKEYVNAIEDAFQLYFVLDSLGFEIEDDVYNYNPDKEIIDFSGRFLTGKRFSRYGESSEYGEFIIPAENAHRCTNAWKDNDLDDAVAANKFPEILTASDIKDFAYIGRGSTRPHHGWIDGKHYVLKCGSYSTMSSDEHVHNEFVADEILRAAGCNVPASREYRADIGHGKVETIRLSEYIEGGMTLSEAFASAPGIQRLKLIRQIVETYPVIAFIDGTDTYQHSILDNILVDAEYNVWFIDNGASFDFRARGLHKGWFWNRTDIRDEQHGFFAVWNYADGAFHNLLGSVQHADLEEAAKKYDYEELVHSLPTDYQRPALIQFAHNLNNWTKGNEMKIKDNTNNANPTMTVADCIWLEDVSLLIAKAVRRIDKFVEDGKAAKTASSRTMQMYEDGIDLDRLVALSGRDPSGRVSALLDVCDSIGNAKSVGFTIKVLADKWQPGVPSTQRPGHPGNVDFTDYAFTREAFEKAGGVIEQLKPRRPTRPRTSATTSAISVVLGDITMLDCDAIVNAANERMLGGGGVDGAIHRAAGSQLYQECLTVPEVRPGVRCPTGEARITGAGRLKCKHVVHTVGPVYRDGKHGEPGLLANCYRNALNLAYDNGVRSIAFPSISTGVYGYPATDAAPIAVREVREFLKTHGDMKVIFCVFNGPRDKIDMKALYDKVINR